jgi:hypothetical protein
MTIYAALRRRWSALACTLLATYYRVLPVLGWPNAMWMRLVGRMKYVLAVGYPVDGERPRQTRGAGREGAS